MGCTTNNESNIYISVTCNCQHGNYYQAIFQIYNGQIDSVDYIVAKRARCSESLFFNCKHNASGNIITFLEDDYIGILGTNKTGITSTKSVPVDIKNNLDEGAIAVGEYLSDLSTSSYQVIV